MVSWEHCKRTSGDQALLNISFPETKDWVPDRPGTADNRSTIQGIMVAGSTAQQFQQRTGWRNYGKPASWGPQPRNPMLEAVFRSPNPSPRSPPCWKRSTRL
jgi:hypothetical protein